MKKTVLHITTVGNAADQMNMDLAAMSPEKLKGLL